MSYSSLTLSGPQKTKRKIGVGYLVNVTTGTKGVQWGDTRVKKGGPSLIRNFKYRHLDSLFLWKGVPRV